MHKHSLLLGLLLSGSGMGIAQEAADSTDNKREMEEYVVTGQFTPQSVGQSVYKVQVISREKIKQKSPNNVQQILNTELGIRFSNDQALGVSDISLMGMSGRNIKILIDGVPLLDRGDIRESLNQIDVNQIEKIEIIEGPMSIMYGSDALAGVINIITVKPEENAWGIQMRIQEETVGREYKPLYSKGLHQQQISGNWDNGKTYIQAGMSHYDFRGFQGDEFNRNHNWKPKEQWMPHLKVGYRGKKHHVYYRPDYLYENIYTKSAINRDTYRGSDKIFRTNKTTQQVQSFYTFNDKFSLNTTGNLTLYRRDTETTIKNFATGESELATGAGEQDRAMFNSFNFRTIGHYVPGTKLSILGGLELNYDKASGDRIEGEPEILDFSVFASAEYQPLDGLKIRPGLRMTKNSLYDAPPVIPSLNLYYRVNPDWLLRASYAQGYRAPALRELYFNFVDANHNLKGNPDLKAENSNSFTASLTYTKVLNRFTQSTEVSTFYNVFDNLISIAANPDDPNEYINVNIDKYKTAGVSVKNKWYHERFDFSIGAIYLGQYNRISEYVSGEVPELTWTPELNVELTFKIPQSKTSMTLFYKYAGKRISYMATTDSLNNVNISTASLQGYHYADFTVNQVVYKFLDVSAGVRNLFDLTDLRNTGVNTGGVHSSGVNTPFGYGRSYFLSMNFNISSNKLRKK